MKTTTTKNTLVWAMLSLFYYSTIYSQVSVPEIKKYWIDGGIGVTSKVNDDNHLAFNYSINYAHNTAVYKLRILSINEFNIFEPNNGLVTIGGLFGKHHSKKFFDISILGGLGITFNKESINRVSGNSGGLWFSSLKYETKKSVSLSIPLEIEIFFKPIKFYGVGLSLFVDINSRRPSFGILFKISFGKLR